MIDKQVNANAPRPGRSLFQFHLRTLFSITGVLALALGMVAVPYQRRAFEEILRRELGGPVPFYVDWSEVPWWSARARRVVFHPKICGIKLLFPIKGFLNDEQLQRVQPSLGSVESLDLRCTCVTDVGMKHVGKLTQLKNLDLSCIAMTDGGLSYLEQLSKLEYLNVVGTEVTDEGLARIRKALPNTKVYHARIRYSGTEYHARLPQERRP